MKDSEIPELIWNFLDKKYRKLITTIANQIGLDGVVYSFEDSRQELFGAMLEAVYAFQKYKLPDAIRKKEIKESEVSTFEYVKHTYFDKYVKTCLWNRKNKIGKRIMVKLEINKNVRLDSESSEYLVDSSSFATNLDGVLPTKINTSSLEEDEKEIINLIETDCLSLHGDGSLNKKYLKETLGVSSMDLNISINKLKRRYYNDL